MTFGDAARTGDQDHDVIMVGAGLASSLTALRLRALRPDIDLCLLEAQPKADEHHTWCCFDTDLSAPNREWMSPLWSNHWDGYQVRFPSHARQLSTGYNRLSAARLNQVRDQALGDCVHYGQPVKSLAADHVVLSDGRILKAPLILDARGATPSPHISLGFQKFLGLEVTTNRPHGVTQPMIMDAAVDQIDGYRFVYVLPLDQDRLLIEDTLYSDGSGLAEADLYDRILAYAAQMNWMIASVDRRETGILPITLEGQFDAYWQALGPAAPLGMKALLFHPTTGYSLPHAVRMADLIARQPRLETSALRPLIEAYARHNWHRGRYLRLLNRMMFRAAEPDQRYLILQRFYRLPQGLIERFYAGRLRLDDRIRILTGKPPVPLMAALRAMRTSKD